MSKLIYLVIDGAADSLSDYTTSLGMANTPALDKVASLSLCGLMYTIGKGVAPESDAAVMALLGYDPHVYYTGRGPLEALGADVEIKEGYEVAFRANFATINEQTLEIVDRRVGRSLLSEEARELAKALDGMKLGLYDGYVRVKATVGHRAVVVVGSHSYRLSDEVDNTDPAYAKVGKISVARAKFDKRVAECKPLVDIPEARRTAELVNVFTRKSIEILSQHPVNLARASRGQPKANVILVRDSGGSLPRVDPIERRFGLKFGAVVEMPVEKGIAKLLGMEVAEVGEPTGDRARDYSERLNATLSLLKKVDAVYVHLKGPDEPGHDGLQKDKAEAIEEIDAHFVKPLLEKMDLSGVSMIVTSDHATPPKARSHTDDPVPVLVYIPGLEPDGISRFTERDCSRGSLGVIEHGWLLLPRIRELLKHRG
ncbi:MAG: alkaline phosphatase family protein [Thermofilaceae archaeon]|nr:alkaline phosphatase family protein [Thermofilaceae archaeon]MDW8004169.1 alkaline phosphatase family protein [Thermofilaceae archaeon]